MIDTVEHGKLDLATLSTGAKQTLSPRLTLWDNGDLSIKNVTYGDTGRFICVVQNAHFGAYVVHHLHIECESHVVFQLVKQQFWNNLKLKNPTLEPKTQREVLTAHPRLNCWLALKFVWSETFSLVFGTLTTQGSGVIKCFREPKPK